MASCITNSSMTTLVEELVQWFLDQTELFLVGVDAPTSTQQLPLNLLYRSIIISNNWPRYTYM
eukprot:54417-Eustigmatos_ZCMA.PRE.1